MFGGDGDELRLVFECGFCAVVRIDCESLSELFLSGDDASADELSVLIFVF